MTENNEARLPVDSFLAIGLSIAGFGPERLSRRTQEKHFKEMYGCLPVVVQHIWYDLKGKIPEKAKIDHLFWALFFLKRYPTSGEMAGRLKKDPVTLRKWIWSIIFGLQELKAEKIRFPAEGSTLIFVISVDGGLCGREI